MLQLFILFSIYDNDLINGAVICRRLQERKAKTPWMTRNESKYHQNIFIYEKTIFIEITIFIVSLKIENVNEMDERKKTKKKK